MLVLAGLACVRVAAQPAACDGKMLEQSRKLDFAYAVRAGGYCDGTVAFDHSTELRLVSYTFGPVRFAPEQSFLKLQRAAPAAEPLKIVGVDKRPDGSYRLDAMLPAGGLDLDLRLAIHPKHLMAEQLGFLAWSYRNGRPIYLPVVAGVPETADAPILVFRTPMSVVQSAYEICIEGRDCSPQQEWASNLAEGSRLELKLSKGPAERNAQVKITVLGPGGRVLGQVVDVVIP